MIPSHSSQYGISSLNMISRGNNDKFPIVKNYLFEIFLPLTNSKSYSFLQPRQCAVKNVPWASTSFSGGIPATRSNESIFCKNQYNLYEIINTLIILD